MSGVSIDWMFSSSSSSSLPKDILIEILLYLPVISLLRFKSVCKSWLTLIESSDFIHRHAITLTPHNSLGTFIFQSRHAFWKWCEINYEISWKVFSISSGDHEFQMLEDLSMPPYDREPNNRLSTVGSCNGVICLHDDELKDVFLWNPAIHQFRRLPKSLTFVGIGKGAVYRDFVAFGFDVETKDYKVVLVTYFRPRTDQDIDDPSKYPHRVQVYSLSTDSWRSLEDLVLPTYPQDGNHGGYLNGSYYGLGQKWVKKVDETMPLHEQVIEVLSFDFTKEIFKTMQFPDEIMPTLFRYINFTLLGEKILVINRFRDGNSDTCHFWVLNELGVTKESWTKLYTIGPYGMDEIHITIPNNGDFIFIGASSADENLLLLNPSTQLVKALQCDGIPVSRVHAYKRSLVPVGGIRNPT